MDNYYKAFKKIIKSHDIKIDDEISFKLFDNIYNDYSFLDADLINLIQRFFDEGDLSNITKDLPKYLNDYLLSLGFDNYNALINIKNKYYKKGNMVFFYGHLLEVLNINFSRDELNTLINIDASLNNYLSVVFARNKDITYDYLDFENNNVITNMIYETYANNHGFTIKIEDLDANTLDNSEDIDCLRLYLNELTAVKPLSEQELKYYLDKYQQNQDIGARNKIVEANLKLVVFIAKKYIGRGLSLQDLIQNGSLGLMKALDHYDYTKGFTFSTYAFWWIKQEITREIANTSRNIRLPVHVHELVGKYLQVKNKLSNILGHDPSYQELADEMNLPLSKIKQISSNLNDTISLYTPVNGGEDATELYEFLSEDKTENESVSELIKTCLKDDVEDVLKTLTDKERLVIKYRMGFYDGRVYTLQEIADMYHITRERIRQIEKKALIKLSKPNVVRKLRSYYDDNDIDDYTIINLFDLIHFDNVDELNFFIDILNKEELSIFKKAYHAKNLDPSFSSMSKKENNTLLLIVGKYNNYLKIINNSLYFDAMTQLVTNPAKFNLYDYLITDDLDLIKQISKKFKILDFNSLLTKVNLVTGCLNNDSNLNREDAFGLVEIIASFNRKAEVFVNDNKKTEIAI